MTEKIKQISVIAVTIFVIVVNYFSASGIINNISPKEVSDKYFTSVTPAGYAFSIWSLIYLGLIIFSIYQLFPSQTENQTFKNIRSLYITNGAANCLWIFLWHYDLIPASLAVMIFILVTLFLINSKLTGNLSTRETWTTKIPFNLYFGWITAASLLNFAVVTVYYGIKFSEFGTIVFSCLLIAAAAFAAVIVRRKYDFPVYSIAVAWALIAIAVNQSSQPIIMIFAALCGILALANAFISKRFS